MKLSASPKELPPEFSDLCDRLRINNVGPYDRQNAADIIEALWRDCSRFVVAFMEETQSTNLPGNEISAIIKQMRK